MVIQKNNTELAELLSQRMSKYARVAYKKLMESETCRWVDRLERNFLPIRINGVAIANAG